MNVTSLLVLVGGLLVKKNNEDFLVGPFPMIGSRLAFVLWRVVIRARILKEIG